MREITNSREGAIESTTSKRLMFGSGVLSFVLLVVLLLVMFSDNVDKDIGNLLGTMSKTETIQFIGWAVIGAFVAAGLAFLNGRSESQAEDDRFVLQEYMKKPIDCIKKIRGGITSKRIIFGFTVLLGSLFAVLVSVVFFNGAAEWIGNLLDIKDDKTETIQFIGCVMGGALIATGFVILNQWWAKSQVKYDRLIRKRFGQRYFKTTMEHMGKTEYIRKALKFMKKIIDGILSKWIMLVFAILLIVLLVALFVVLVLVMLYGGMTESVGDILGIYQDKTEIIEFIGWAMSGVSVAIGIVVLGWRAEAQLENNRLIGKGHEQERFKTATEHLGHDKASVRIAAFYEFVHLVNVNKEEKYQGSVLEILYAHIRTTTTDSEYGNKTSKSSESKTVNCESKIVNDKSKPTEEIQGLLDGLFKSKRICCDDTKPNLQRSYLSGADLVKSDLSNADLRKVNLSKANLSEANLSGANLLKVNLSKANLSGANLSGANLSGGSNLNGADFFRANLSGARLAIADAIGAEFIGTVMTGANLNGINLTGAKLNRANLTGAKLYYGGADRNAKLLRANLSEADLTGVHFYKADLTGANLSKADLTGVRFHEADLAGANLSEADLSKVQLGGTFYTKETRFPEWFEPPIAPPDNGDKVQFPKGFIAPEKPEGDE